eukprot:Sspe_Gene.89937::Locus_61596_Transcript_1_1_Confidence_1.000_Length_617::g.89937::m.89937/K08504/BET1; blocked early in transport 1
MSTGYSAGSLHMRNSPSGIGGPRSSAFGGGSSGGLSGRGGLGAGGNGAGGRGRYMQEEMEEEMLRRNEEGLDQMAEGVTRLKHIVLNIGAEVDEQNSLLDKLTGGFESATGAVKSTLGKMDAVFKSGGSKHMCMLVAFVFAVLFALYYLLRNRGS